MLRTHTLTAVAISFIAGLSLACEESPGTFSAVHAELYIDAQTVTFGERYIGTHSAVYITLRNPGNAATEAAIEVQGPGATAFLVEPRTVVNAESEKPLRIEFVPDRAGALEAVLVVAHNGDSPSPRWLEIVGAGKAPPSCDDQNDCTDDWFDLEEETCQSQPRSGSCDDGSACTEGDTCVDARCVGRTVECRDFTDCTRDTCDRVEGCVFIPQHNLCGDDDPCTADVCNEILGCMNPPVPEGTLCDTPSCEEFAICIAGQCIRGPTPDNFPCEDGDVCTTEDTCQGGECVAGEGLPFGLVPPIEIETRSTQGSPVARILDLDAEQQDNIVVAYHTEVASPDPCDCLDQPCDDPEDPDCGHGDVDIDIQCCGCPTFSGGEVRVVTASGEGAVLQDHLVAVSNEARAALHEGDLYVAANYDPDGDCPTPPSLAVWRYHEEQGRTQVITVPPSGAIEDEFAIAVVDDRVVVAQLYSEIWPDCIEGEECPDVEPELRFHVRLIRFTRDLTLLDERVATLARDPIFAVKDVELQPRGSSLDVTYLASSYDHDNQFLDHCAYDQVLTRAMIAVDVVDRDTLGLPTLTVAAPAEAISPVTSTFPTGVVLVRWNRDMTMPAPDPTAVPPLEAVGDPPLPGEEPATDSDPDPDAPPASGSDDGGVSRDGEPGNACSSNQQLVFYEATGHQGPLAATVLDDSGRDILYVEAIPALGQLGALLLRRGGTIEAVVPASGLVPETHLNLSFPEESLRQWLPVSPPVASEVARGVYAAGVSDDHSDAVADCNPADDRIGPPGLEEDKDPACELAGRRIVVAGAGCGVGTPP